MKDQDARRVLRGGFFRSSLPAATQAGFFAAVLTIFVIAVVSYRSLLWKSEGARLVSRTLVVTNELNQLLSIYKDAETGQRGYLITGEARYLEPYEAAIAAVDGQAAKVRGLIADNPAQQQRLDEIQRRGHVKRDELAQTVALRRAGKVNEALALVLSDQGKRAMDAVRAGIIEMKDAERALLEQRTRDWDMASSVSTGVTWGGSGLLLLLVVAAAMLSSRDFQAQKVQTWIRTGQSALGARLQDAETVGALAERVAAYLGETFEAPVAAVYFSERPGTLRRVGGFGVPKGDDEAVGLTREAFLGRKLIETTDVPADFFPVRAGVGQGRARSLVVLPTTAGGRANGVMELGFFTAVMPADLELLRAIAEPVGLALRAAQDRHDLAEALEESQRQGEELQTQQEEMSVQNEELEQQSRALQESQGRLENQQAELEQINAHLEEQTQAVSRQRDDLVRAQSELQRASAYKSEFLANMSHELRTPLNSSLILAKLLADNRDGNLTGEQIKFAETIYAAGNDLLTLINDILDLSKIEAGKLDVRPEDVAVARVVDELGDVFRPVAKEKGLALEAIVEPGAPAHLVTDPTRLMQILRNLLSNALKFTERGRVTLRVRRAGAGLAFEVQDTGIGIAPEQHDVIFEAFRQADGTTNRKYGGTGLGLSISRDLARLLGGDLALDSVPGRGSTFTLTLPPAFSDPAARPTADVDAEPARGAQRAVVAA
ncbi:MAG TPA: CHASE3 domain-containing protein, partial [Polyangia bacterium]|nr:CHASE3 domain-containing protein [Polyangia bacterium]